MTLMLIEVERSVK